MNYQFTDEFLITQKEREQVLSDYHIPYPIFYKHYVLNTKTNKAYGINKWDVRVELERKNNEYKRITRNHIS